MTSVEVQGEEVIAGGPGLDLRSVGSVLGVREGKRNLWSARQRTGKTTLESEATRREHASALKLPQI